MTTETEREREKERETNQSIHLSYKPTDFFYYKSNLTPTEFECKDIMMFPCDETADNWNDMSFNCYRKELCKNRKLANEVLESQNVNLETGERQNDIESIYQHHKLKTINLFGGIFAMITILVFSK